MYLFKFYRPNFYFEKSIKYDEIYFSANDELNDPLDLKVLPYFSDDVELWLKLLNLEPKRLTDLWDIKKFIQGDFVNLAKDLNDLFKGKKPEADKTVSSFIEQHSKELGNIFLKYINHHEEMASDERVKHCTVLLTELLSRGWNKRFYSCSFSMTALEPMMWAHYSDGFKGCVIIYRCEKNNVLNLKPHHYATSYESYPFAKVSYEGTGNNVCILEHAIRNESINFVLLSKSKLWSYEKEQRLLMSQSFETFKLLKPDTLPLSDKTRIYHHAPEAIVGVIYGPNCSKAYKKKIESILVEKYSYCCHMRSRFLALDASLSEEGDVIIKSGSICSSTAVGSPVPMMELLTNGKLASILEDIGVN